MADQRVHFAILEHLAAVRQNAPEEQAAQLSAAIECLEGAFALSLADINHKTKFSLYPKSLPEVFNAGIASSGEDAEFQSKFEIYIDKLKARNYFDVPPQECQTRFEKAKLKFKEGYDGLKAKRGAEKSAPTEQDKEKANALKNKGNELLLQRKFLEAIDAYTEAIALVPTDSIYYCNRAAAYTHLQQNDKALIDCQKAVELDPKYAKAYSRMGLAYFNLNKYQDAATSYKKALELDPANVQFKQGLDAAEEKGRESSSGAAPDLSALLTNPAISQMAQSFAQQMNQGGAGPGAVAGQPPNFSQLLQDPAVQNLMRGEGGGGDVPSFASLMNNPNIMNMAQQAMQNPAIQGMVNNLMQNPDSLNALLSNLGSTLGRGNGGENATQNNNSSAPMEE